MPLKCTLGTMAGYDESICEVPRGQGAVLCPAIDRRSYSGTYAGLTPEQLRRHPEPGKWSIHQIVAHLADCELVFQTRARMIMFQNNPTLVSFDQDPWVLGWMRENEPWDETMQRFRVLRKVNSAAISEC